MAIKCFFADNADFGHNWTCIPFKERLQKSTNGEKKNHPCPFHDFGECKEWMEEKKFEFLWDIWCKKYDQGGINSADFYNWTRDLKDIDPSAIWKFMDNEYNYLKFIGYEDPRWTDREKLEHKFELFSFSAFDRENPKEDCCINDNCSTWCNKYIICPIRRHQKELLKIGIPSELKKCSSYTRFRWHINKVKGEIKQNYRKKHTNDHMARTIWYILREIAAEDFSSPEVIQRRGYIPMEKQNVLQIKVEI